MFRIENVEEPRGTIISELSRNLRARGFKVSDPELSGLVSFDLMARREDERYFLKVLYNVDTIRRDAAVELLTLARMTDSACVVVGERSGAGRLEDGIVYYRHSIPIMSLMTFVDYVDGERPYVFSGPGGYYVSINGTEMRRTRQNRGFSIGYVSGKIGTSRRSVSLYESGSAATVEVFMKIQALLESDIKKSIDFREEIMGMDVYPSESEAEDELLRTVSGRITEAGYTVNIMHKSPFDALARHSRETLIMGLLDLIGKDYKRASAMRNISDILENDLIILARSRTERTQISGCPVVNIPEFLDFCDRGDLEALLERKKRGL